LLRNEEDSVGFDLKTDKDGYMNIRAKLLSFAVLLAVLVAPTAGAIEISAIGATTVTVEPGEAFSFELAIDNASLTSTVGIEVTLSGMLAAGAVLTSGQSAVANFVQVCTPSACFGGLNTIDNTFYNPNDLGASGAYTPGDDSALVANTISTSGATAQSGEGDPGLLGAINEPSALDVVMNMTATTSSVFEVTGKYSDSVDVLPIEGSVMFTVNVPEPSAIASSLAGLGAVFAVAGLRRRN
jgi:hypothetical protein